MKIYVATSGAGFVEAAGPTLEGVKAKVEASSVFRDATEVEWVQEYGQRFSMKYRSAVTGRWNTVPHRFIEPVEMEES